jgi:hypothetical protein
MMNNWQNEFLPEYHRERIVTEMEKIRLGRLALKSHVYRPGFFAKTMFKFANWMITTGKQLRKRYDVPAVNSSNPASESFAHW